MAGFQPPGRLPPPSAPLICSPNRPRGHSGLDQHRVEQGSVLSAGPPSPRPAVPPPQSGTVRGAWPGCRCRMHVHPALLHGPAHPQVQQVRDASPPEATAMLDQIADSINGMAAAAWDVSAALRSCAAGQEPQGRQPPLRGHNGPTQAAVAARRCCTLFWWPRASALAAPFYHGAAAPPVADQVDGRGAGHMGPVCEPGAHPDPASDADPDHVSRLGMLVCCATNAADRRDEACRPQAPWRAAGTAGRRALRLPGTHLEPAALPSPSAAASGRVPENSGQNWGSMYPRDDLRSVAQEICQQVNSMQASRGGGGEAEGQPGQFAFCNAAAQGATARHAAAAAASGGAAALPKVPPPSPIPPPPWLQSTAQEQFNIVLTIPTLPACQEFEAPKEPSEGAAPAPAPAARRMLKA